MCAYRMVVGKDHTLLVTGCAAGAHTWHSCVHGGGFIFAPQPDHLYSVTLTIEAVGCD